MIASRCSRPRGVRCLLAGLLVLVLSGWAVRPAAAELADAAQTLVERAATHIQAVGAARAFADITRPGDQFTDGELYVFCLDADGTVLANASNPKLVGKNLSAVQDTEGRLPAAEIYRVGHTQGQGWVEYLWPNPQTRRVQRKVTYTRRIDDGTVCAAGYYKTDPP